MTTPITERLLETHFQEVTTPDGKYRRETLVPINQDGVEAAATITKLLAALQAIVNNGGATTNAMLIDARAAIASATGEPP